MACEQGTLRQPVRELALFAGAGGGILGGKLLGWRCVCAVERDRYAAAVLAARQNDKSLAPFPIWDDVSTFDGKPWRGLVDVVSGGFPCQDISTAGKGAGIEGAKSGLWREFARVIDEVRPSYVLVENSPALTSRGLGVVLGDLAALGYNAEWGVLGAEDAIWIDSDPELDHERERIWIVATRADCDGLRELQSQGGFSDIGGWLGDVRKATSDAGSGRLLEQREGQGQQPRRAETVRSSEADADSYGNDDRRNDKHRKIQSKTSPPEAAQRWQDGERVRTGFGDGSENRSSSDSCSSGLPVAWPVTDGAHGRDTGRVPTTGHWWSVEPAVGRVADGVAHRVDRIRALGNGQSAPVVALAWHILGPVQADTDYAGAGHAMDCLTAEGTEAAQ